MKILVAPNSFKDSLNGIEVASAIERGIRRVVPDATVIKCPVADGGDGLIDVLAQSINCNKISHQVSDPLFRCINSEFLYLSDKKSAIIEMAKASGLALLKIQERNAMQTTTFGTGELIRKALDLGAKTIYLGLGGSATCDGGIGILTALGVVFLDEKGLQLKPVGNSLSYIRRIDMRNLDARILSSEFIMVCDVENPLLGINGAAKVFAPQKGATPDEVEALENGLKNLASIIKKDTNLDINIIGGGAAGGISATLYGLIGGKLKKGIDTIIDILDIQEKIKGVDLVITGEGKIDGQTAFGKAPAGIAVLAKKNNIPCIAIAGLIGNNIDELYGIGFTSIFPICRGPITLEDSVKNADNLISDSIEQIIRLLVFI